MQRHERVVHDSSRDAPRPSRPRVTDQPVPETGDTRLATGENETRPRHSLSSNLYQNVYQTVPTNATTSTTST